MPTINTAMCPIDFVLGHRPAGYSHMTLANGWWAGLIEHPEACRLKSCKAKFSNNLFWRFFFYASKRPLAFRDFWSFEVGSKKTCLSSWFLKFACKHFHCNCVPVRKSKKLFIAQVLASQTSRKNPQKSLEKRFNFLPKRKKTSYRNLRVSF